MAEPKSNELMEKIVSLCKRKGFIFQSSEIYGGINGFWDYGPLGAELKRNVKELWWHTMTRFRDDVVGLEATIIMHPQIWRASGHVDTFADLMVECKLTNRRFRADQVEPMSGKIFSFVASAHPEEVETIRALLPSFKKTPADPDAFVKEILQDLVDAENQEKVAEKVLEYGGTTYDDTVISSLNAVRTSLYREPFRVLIQEDQHPGSALTKAQKFYQKRTLSDVSNVYPIPIRNRNVQTEEMTTRFNSEKGEGFGCQLTEPRPFNLMFKTFVGPVESEDNVAYLRPETAQAIFAQFKNVLDSSRQMPPFGIAQIGKAFRNEVTPRNYTFRSREFEQMELEFFIKPDEVIEAISGHVATISADNPHSALRIPQSDWGWQAWHQYWVEERVRFYEGIGLSRETLGFHRQTPEELAHYARACVDILFKFPFSKIDEQGQVEGDELEGIAARSDFDLSQHQRFSGRPMGVFDEELRTAWGKLDEAKKKGLWQGYFENRKKYLTKTAKPDETPEQIQKQATEDADGLAKGQYIPHVIEPSAGVDRLILALISNAYHEEPVTDEKGKSETRIVMKFHPRVAPIKVGVFPLLKNKPELVKKAREVRDLLRPHLTVFYDEAGAIGRRYRRQDEAGTPFCVTIDFDTLGEKPELLNTITLRERDTMRQTRVKLDELPPLLLEKIR